MSGKEKPAKAPKAAKAAKAGKPARAGKVKGDGLLTVWSIAHGVIFGGLWWMAWLAIERAPGEDPMHVAAPYGAVGAACFLVLMVNIADAMARGQQQGH
jgi:apolipoprotein N-acyltransferase